MTFKFKLLLAILILAIIPVELSAQDFIPADSLNVDSLLSPIKDLQEAPTKETQKFRGPFTQVFKKDTKFLRYLDGLVLGNEDHTFDKKFDVGFIVMPSYTREGSFGIGGGATGLYRLDKTDSIMAPSDVTLIGNVTLNGLFSLVANGNNLFPGRKLRFSYKLEFAYSPLDFWGITYDDCATNQKISYTRQMLKLNTDLVYRLKGPFYLGASVDINFSHVLEADNWDYLRGQEDHYFFTGLGASFQYDTRDFIPNPSRGMYLKLKGSIRPQLFSSFDRTLFNASLVYNYYLRMWKGAMFAFDLYGSYNSPESPWPLRESLGAGGIRMRGYYAGRYIDNCMLSGQFEYRQHVFDRLGLALWVGTANVFHGYHDLRFDEFLPNWGIGLRVELKHNLNGRIDYGFGKNTGGFVFSIGEAF